jgi:cell division protein ZapA (FtsZ GTPase activity inhibitor)
MTRSEELHAMARDMIQMFPSIDERRYSVIRALNSAADEIDRLSQRVEELEREMRELEAAIERHY